MASGGALRGLLAAWLCAYAAPAAAGDATILHYTARLHGIGLLDATFCMQLERTSYTTTLMARTLGVVDFLVHGLSHSHASGMIDSAGGILPHDYADQSRLSGEDYAVALDFPAGSPVLRLESPPQEKYRLPVVRDELTHSVDGLSAVVLQSLVATRQHVCVGETLVYDGRQLRRLSMQTGGQDVLKPNAHSTFAGQALRCETDSTMIAGFLKSPPVAQQSKPRHGRLWLAPALPGGPDVPVRMVFDAESLGDVVVDLDAVSSGLGCNTDRDRSKS